MVIEWVALGALLLARGEKKDNKPMDISTSKNFDSLFKKYQNNCYVRGFENWKVLKAIAMNESSLGTAKSVAYGMANPNDTENSKSTDGKSWGLMQVTLPTAKQFDMFATPAKLNDPDYSVKIASLLIGWISAQFKPTDPQYLEWIIKSYNQGVGNTRKEIANTSQGFAGEYWERFKRNYEKIKGDK